MWRADAYETNSEITLKRFLEASGLGLEDVYSANHCWSDVLEAGAVPTLPNGPEERALRRALGRLLHLDDEMRIQQYRNFAQATQPPTISSLALPARRLFHMLATVLTESTSTAGVTLDDAASLIWKHPQVLTELGELMDVLAERIDHVQVPLSSYPNVPLYVHARYTRREILAAFGDGETLKVAEWREGVRWLPDSKVDLLAFTFDKTSGHFSPTTRYRDYAISRKLIHWESQSGTRAESESGQRYQQHETNGSTVLPFARLTADERAFWLLGPAIYVEHEGERPMGITWQLAHDLPGDLYARFAAAVS